MNKSYLEKYSRLIVKIGINIQENQILVINSPIECFEVTRMISEVAYKEGAREVVINWIDDTSTRIKYLHGKEEIFDEYPDWKKEFYNSYVRKGAAFLTISASDPELMNGVNSDRLNRAAKASGIALMEYKDKLMSDKNVWCVVSIPTIAWAKKVFPELNEDEAVEKLWQKIFEAVRVTEEDPVAAWKEHQSRLKKSLDFLNDSNFKYLVYKNSIGTDLKIELPEAHQWLGGSSFSPEGTEFMANMPTEEVFTLPLKNGVNGKVVSSKPLNYNGSLIESFSLTFKDGRIVTVAAESGYENLQSLVDTDEGSHYLGEVALVPFDSPISNANILFYNTLFDENASCHLAIGEAYPTCLKNGENMTKDELSVAGVNYSLTHVDFMLGTSDLSIIGITSQGKEVEVFKNGNFVIQK